MWTLTEPYQFDERWNYLTLVRLMQDAGIEPADKKNTKDWYNSGKSSFRHHTEYLRRLTKLREDLLREEQKGLSKAISRLRQIPDTDPQGLYKTSRGEARDQRKILPRLPNHHILVEKVLTSTAERFRLMKQPKPLPKLVPLEGKQVFGKIEKEESSKQIKVTNHVSFGRTSSEELYTEGNIKIDLKKFLKPSCSIPSIGPRALRHAGISLAIDNFVIDDDRANQSQYAQSLGKRTQTNKLHITKQPPQRSLIRADSDSLDLNPLSVKFENSYLEERTRIKLDDPGNDTYCIPSNTPESRFDPDQPSIDCTMCKQERHSSKNNYQSEHSPNPNRNGIRHISLPLLETNDLLNSPNSALANYKEYCYGTSAIKKSSDTPDTSNDNGKYGSKDRVTPKRRTKVRINVHVPSIVQTSATPDSSSPDTDDTTHSTTGGKRFRTLVKTWIQNDIRVKEVTNLLEDVRDLNQRSLELSIKYS